MSSPRDFKANYNIKAKPTTYAGVTFRSRLEARWAAFFDICGLQWKYEPRFDFIKGWLPDFLITTSACEILAEVKPIDIAYAEREYRCGKDVNLPDYHNALRYYSDLPIILLGNEPNCLTDTDDIIGTVVTDWSRVHAAAGCTLEELYNSLRVTGFAPAKWHEADYRLRGIPASRHILFPDFG